MVATATLDPFAAPSQMRLADPRLQAYLIARAPFFVHATGRFANMARTIRDHLRRAANLPTASANSEIARQISLNKAHQQYQREQQRQAYEQHRQRIRAPAARTPVQAGIASAMTAGAIPAALGTTLMIMTDVAGNNAIRSQAAHEVSQALARLQDRAFGAEGYLAQANAMGKHLDGSQQGLKAAQTNVRELLGAVYRDPRKAFANLARLAQSCDGPGHMAREIARRPEILGNLRGGFFSRNERAEALRHVAQLTGAVEARGRAREQLDRDKHGMAEIRTRPDRQPELKAALAAHGVLSAIQAVLPGADKVNASILAKAAHHTATQTTMLDIGQAQGLSPEYRDYLTDVAQRRDSLQALQQTREGANPVDHFERAATTMVANADARDQYLKAGDMIAAEQASEWAKVAEQEMLWSTKAIMANPAVYEDASTRGILPAVMELQQKDAASFAATDPQQDAAAPQAPSLSSFQDEMAV